MRVGTGSSLHGRVLPAAALVLGLLAASTAGADVLRFVEKLTSQGLLSRSSGEAIFTADGETLYAPASGGIHIFRRDPLSGALALVETQTGLLLTGGARTLSPDGAHFYHVGCAIGVGETNPSSFVQRFARDPATDRLSPLGRESGARGCPLPPVWSPDGAHLYVATRLFDRDGFLSSTFIATYARDAVTGALTHVAEREGGAPLAMAADGATLYAHEGATLEAYARDPASGQLAPIQSVPVGSIGYEPAITDAVLVSPDAAHVYASNWFESRIVWYRRAAATGRLEPAGVVEQGVDGVSGIDSVMRLLLSPDGRHLYARGASSPELALFARDAADGALAFAGTIPTRLEERLGFGMITLTPDGAQAYATSDAEQLPGAQPRRRSPLRHHSPVGRSGHVRVRARGRRGGGSRLARAVSS